jgi:uncharacterized membrane protein YcfT
MGASLQNGTSRVDWVDCAKGLCIVMVVMMHSTLGVEDYAGSQGFMHAVVEFAKPFRMPDFFLISGLFLARVIDRDWRTYLDRKVVHFAYFYVLWVTIQFAFKAHTLAPGGGVTGLAVLYLEAFIEPFGTLWFIYLLPIFFVVSKALRNVSPVLVWLVAAALEIAPIDTGWTVIDEFASRFVYFYTGYIAAKYVFIFAQEVAAHRIRALIGLEFWAAINTLLVVAGRADMPFVSLFLGLSGAMAVVTVAVLVSGLKAFEPVRYCGQNSIVIYLAFFLPMSLTRTVLLKTGIVPDIGAVALIVTLAGITGALAIWWAVRNTRLSFLFVRPEAFKLPPRPAFAMQPAE